jgi:hypothetical protein
LDADYIKTFKLQAKCQAERKEKDIRLRLINARKDLEKIVTRKNNLTYIARCV